jgi:hypothetical protein
MYVLAWNVSQNLISFLIEWYRLEYLDVKSSYYVWRHFRASSVILGIVVIKCQLFVCSYELLIRCFWKCQLQNDVRTQNAVFCYTNTQKVS